MNAKSNTGRAIKIPARGTIEESSEVDFRFPAMNRLLYGDGNVTVERVRPYGLATFNNTLVNGNEVVLIVDEDGMAKRLPFNSRASFIYGWQFHGQPILGDAYLVGETVAHYEDGPDWVFTGLPESLTLEVVAGIVLTASLAMNERELAGK